MVESKRIAKEAAKAEKEKIREQKREAREQKREERKEAREQKREERKEVREQKREAREQKREERKEAREQKREERKEAREQKREERKEVREQKREAREQKREERKEAREQKREERKEEREQRRKERAAAREARRADKLARDANKLEAWREGEEGRPDSYTRQAIDKIIADPYEGLAFLNGKGLNLNITSKTVGGRVWWHTVAAYKGWHIQEHKITTHWRLLDPDMRRRAWANRTKFAHAMRELSEGDLSQKHPFDGFGYDNGHQKGMNEGYKRASKEYEDKLRKQAAEFISQKKDWQRANDEYEELLDEYEDYIEQLELSQASESDIEVFRAEYDQLEALCK